MYDIIVVLVPEKSVPFLSCHTVAGLSLTSGDWVKETEWVRACVLSVIGASIVD